MYDNFDAAAIEAIQKQHREYLQAYTHLRMENARDGFCIRRNKRPFLTWHTQVLTSVERSSQCPFLSCLSESIFYGRINCQQKSNSPQLRRTIFLSRQSFVSNQIEVGSVLLVGPGQVSGSSLQKYWSLALIADCWRMDHYYTEK